MAGVFLSLRRVLPNTYPLDGDVEDYIADEQRLGRLLDYAVIVPRLQRLYEWSAQDLDEPRLLELVRDGNPIYAWPFEQRHVWRTPNMPLRGAGTRTRHTRSLKAPAAARRFRPCARPRRGSVLSLVNGSRRQPPQRSTSVIPASRAIRSSSDGQT